MSANSTEKQFQQSDWLAASLLAFPALLSLMLVLHHPALHGVHEATEIAQQISRMASLDGVVHGGLMLMYGMQAVGFYLFSSRLGWSRSAVVAGFMAYAASVLVLVIPATLDGFVTPDIIAHCLPAPGGCAAVESTLFPFIGAMIGDFTKIALVATSIALLLWSLPLLALNRLASRGAGAAGLLCGGAPIAVMVFSNITLQPHNLAAVILCQVIWSLIAAALIISGVVSNRHLSLAPRALDAPTG